MDLSALTFVIVAFLTHCASKGTSSPVNRKIRLHSGIKKTKSRAISERSSSEPVVRAADLPTRRSTVKPPPASLEERVIIYSKTGYFLQIPFSGKIRGSLDKNSKFVQLVMEVVFTSVVRIKGEHTKNYLAMNSDGNLYVSKTANEECLFKETMERTDFHTFASYAYSGKNAMNLSGEWYLAIKRNGKARHALNTTKRQKATQFLVVRRGS
ncbi:fibroblast growth factor 1 [Exaiptasia diaphana]|uniref:Fibroblast growth factor n=1 Tax=Exaiptasia diaphana TaxID=2652724 RepID=A0A913YBH6_EXADI|nr:fibroblast growth factor 1 [Exaiptasia diaphana]